MTTALASMMEFAETVWANRTTVRGRGSISKQVSEIYSYYNYSNARKMPGWRNILPPMVFAFSRRCGDLNFKFQGKDMWATGAEIGDALQILVDIASAPNPQIAGLIAQAHTHLVGWDTDVEEVLEALEERLRSKVVDSYREGTLSEHDARAELERIDDEGVPRPDLKSDPGLVLQSFVWNYARSTSSGKYRIYVTPFLREAAGVYCEFVRFINGSDPIDGLDHTLAPARAKIGIPGATEATRIDRIVIYCASEAEMQNGVEWFRRYQSARGFDMKFENRSPRGTRAVEGLRGVAVTVQPVADPGIMAQAGVTKVKGMSFGKSRAAVLGLALQDATSLPDFKNRLERIARQAGLFLGLDQVDPG